MNAEDLFIDTLEDLRRRCDLRAGEYDMVQVAGLIRRLVLDGLWSTVNQEHRLKPTCSWGRLRVALRLSSGEAAWLPMVWLDPLLTDLKLAKELAPESRPEVGPWTGTLSKFMKHDAIVAGADHVGVEELVRYYANRAGGVHHDPRPPDNPLLALLSFEADEGLRYTILAAGRVIYRSLEPLAALIILGRQLHPLGIRQPSDATGTSAEPTA